MNNIRIMPSGATRSPDTGKFEYDGFFHPAVMFAYANYLHKHRVQSDGNYRESDNWQKGMPISVYMQSLLRHIMDMWLIHRGWAVQKYTKDGIEHMRITSPEENQHISDNRVDMLDAACAAIFNLSGIVLELLRERGEYTNGD